MALFTLGSDVHANQWKVGQVVVEKNFVVPAFFVVAIVALLTLLTAMNIVFFVAFDTVGFQFIFFDFSLVAE
jgi:hypothetical protein